MKSILEKIMLSAMMCKLTGGDPDVEAKKCVDEIMSDLFGDSEKAPSDVVKRVEENKDMDRSVEMLKAALSNESGTIVSIVLSEDGKANQIIKGRGILVKFALNHLIVDAARQFSDGDTKSTLDVLDRMFAMAKAKILSGGGIDDAKDCAEKVED